MELQDLIAGLAVPTKEATDRLTILQRTPDAWPLASALLSPSNPPAVQFFGAHTLQFKVSTDSFTAFGDSQRHSSLRELLFGSLTRSAETGGVSPVVRNKLCQAVATYIIRLQTWAVHEGVPMSPEYAAIFTINGDLIEPDSLVVVAIEQLQQMLGSAGGSLGGEILLEVLGSVPKEFALANVNSMIHGRVHSAVGAALPNMLHICREALSNLSNVSVASKALQCLREWIHFGLPLTEFAEVFKIALKCALPQGAASSLPALLDPALELASECLAHRSAVKIQLTIGEAFLEYMSTDFVTSLVNAGSNAESAPQYEDAVRPVAGLLVAYIENHCEHLVPILPRSDVISMLRNAVQIQRWSGYFGADQGISDITLPIWYYLQETMMDYELTLPLSDPSEYIESQSSSSKYTRGQIMELAQVLFTEVTGVLLERLLLPPTHTWNAEWTKEQREQYTTFRRDVGDSLLNCYYVLQGSLLGHIVDRVLQAAVSHKQAIDSNSNEIPQTALLLESNLYALNAVSEALPEHESMHISRLLNEELLLFLMTQTHSQSTHRRAIVRFVGCDQFSRWLSKHREPHLVIVLRSVIFSGMKLAIDSKDKAMMNEATRALRQLVTGAGRGWWSISTNGAGGFAIGEELVNNLQSVVFMADVDLKHRELVLESICEIIQAWQSRQFVDSVVAIMESIVPQLTQVTQQLLQAGVIDEGDKTVAGLLRLLRICCIGIHPANSTTFGDSITNSAYIALIQQQQQLTTTSTPTQNNNNDSNSNSSSNSNAVVALDEDGDDEDDEDGHGGGSSLASASEQVRHQVAEARRNRLNVINSLLQTDAVCQAQANFSAALQGIVVSQNGVLIRQSDAIAESLSELLATIVRPSPHPMSLEVSTVIAPIVSRILSIRCDTSSVNVVTQLFGVYGEHIASTIAQPVNPLRDSLIQLLSRSTQVVTATINGAGNGITTNSCTENCFVAAGYIKLIERIIEKCTILVLYILEQSNTNADAALTLESLCAILVASLASHDRTLFRTAIVCVTSMLRSLIKLTSMVPNASRFVSYILPLILRSVLASMGTGDGSLPRSFVVSLTDVLQAASDGFPVLTRYTLLCMLGLPVSQHLVQQQPELAGMPHFSTVDAVSNVSETHRMNFVTAIMTGNRKGRKLGSAVEAFVTTCRGLALNAPLG
ncbi:hypothetical protein GQ42DRAFT_163508 [Ramicandelaber brevisporus]|nr:hypothetical protein GQ42DRAFT_163508 [Ramicandelaber brevisporus]